MKTVTIYETRDGDQFPSIEAAKKHEAWLDFEEWFEEHEISNSSHDELTAWTMITWLLENKEYILNLYKVLE